MKLPAPFLERMKESLGDAFDAFIESYQQPHHVSIKVNTNKIAPETFKAIFPFALEPVPWTTDGFYCDSEAAISKHPYFQAGLYYIQEPSAMSPVNVLRPKAGDFCLDLCAAPGGKSMQISNFIKDEGLLVSNDIHENRVKAILRNAERFGLRNILILNDQPQQIEKVIGPVFDAILIDAPCSGEGMFRKDERAVKSWEVYGPDVCHKIQREILDTVPGLSGAKTEVVYSTCTFAEVENEVQMAYMTTEYPVFKPHAITLAGVQCFENTAHIWPHMHRGEGHFIGALEKASEGVTEKVRYAHNEPPEPVAAFMAAHLKQPFTGHFAMEKERVFLRPMYQVPTKGLHVVREGLLLGEIKKGRFSPSQALALYLKKEDFSPVLDLSAADLNTMKYLKGETIHVDVVTEGLHLVCTDGYPLGFAKISKGTLKNLYPPSWRML